MKMSKVFKLPMGINDGQVLFDGDGDYAGSNIWAAAHAINLHDELVKELDSMTKLNEKMIREFNGRVEPWSQIDEEHLHYAAILVAKARG